MSVAWHTYKVSYISPSNDDNSHVFMIYPNLIHPFDKLKKSLTMHRKMKAMIGF